MRKQRREKKIELLIIINYEKLNQIKRSPDARMTTPE